jgi:hypothetical protein
VIGAQVTMPSQNRGRLKLNLLLRQQQKPALEMVAVD